MKGIRLGYIKGKKDGSNPAIALLDEIDAEYFQNILNAIEILNKYKFSKDLFKIFETNFNEFIMYPQDILEKCIVNDSYQDQDSYFNCNRLFINFLSSFRVYIDYTSSYLKKKYGHSSEHTKAFERCMSYFFDNIFAYRFMYKLRNFSQHCGFPIDTIRFSANLDTQTDAVKATLKILFDRDKLLKAYAEWGKVKKDLEAMDTEFDVIKLTNDLHFCISELSIFLNKVDKPSLGISKHIIQQAINRIDNNNATACIFYDFVLKDPNSYEGAKFTVLELNDFLAF